MKLFSLYLCILILTHSIHSYSSPFDNAHKPLLFTGALLSGLCGGSLLWKTMAHSASPAKSNLKKKVSGADEQGGFNYSLKQAQKFLSEPGVCIGTSIGLLGFSAFFLHKATKS